MATVKNISDEELVKMVRSQDQELYTKIVKRYQNKLLRYAQTIVKDPDQAADVVQQTFIKAFINLRGFNTHKKFSSWIYQITHNEAINLIKKHHQEKSLEGNEWPEDIFIDKNQPDLQDQLEKKENKQKITQSLAKLPLKYRTALTG